MKFWDTSAIAPLLIDAMQLAAALFACENRPANFEFVCLDSRLADAAAREGFTLLDGEKARKG